MPRFTILLLLVALFWVYGGLAIKPWCSLIDTALVDWSTSSIPIKTHKECHLACLESPSCESANYWSRNKTCELNSASHVNVSGRYLVQQPGSVYTYASEDGCHRAFGTTPRDVCTSSEYSISSRGWRRVFKGVAGTERKLYTLWTGQNWTESLEDKGSWRNNKLHDAWQSGQLIVKRVSLSLWVGTEKKVQLMFNGTGSDISSWFSQENLISSPWLDLKNAAKYESGYYFSIDGYEPVDRRFYINYSWGGCGNDQGWLVVTESQVTSTQDGKDNQCPWELEPTGAHPYSIILYSATKNKVVWNDDTTANVGRADFLTIDVETE